LGLGSGLEFATICPVNHRIAFAWAGILGATGVVLGALGAHPLKAALEAAGKRDTWETAVTFQLVHAAAMLGLAGWMSPLATSPGRCAAWSVRLLVAGTVLFSGSLYGLAFGGPRWLGPATPLGGAALIGGWITAACAAFDA